LQQGATAIVFAAFDCLYFDGHDLRDQPLSTRRTVLEEVIDGAERSFAARRLAANGLAASRAAQKKGFEGLVAKDASSTYAPGRSRRWLKVKVVHQDEFVIGGYTDPAGARSRFGALLLGGYRDGQLYYVGRVGTGFSESRLQSLWRSFQALASKSPAFVDPPRERGLHWLRPKLVAQVGYSEWTADRRLRQPVFLGLRDDKEAAETSLPDDAP
jgi:bifunctional non-homologous end joining protein LigD